jgi:hypothetical protein
MGKSTYAFDTKAVIERHEAKQRVLIVREANTQEEKETISKSHITSATSHSPSIRPVAHDNVASVQVRHRPVLALHVHKRLQDLSTDGGDARFAQACAS